MFHCHVWLQEVILQLPSLLNRNFPSNEHMFSMECDCWPMLEPATGDTRLSIRGSDSDDEDQRWWRSDESAQLLLFEQLRASSRYVKHTTMSRKVSSTSPMFYATVIYANVRFHGHTSRNSPILQQLTRKASQKATILRYQCQLWVYHLNHISYIILFIIYCISNHVYIYIVLC